MTILVEANAMSSRACGRGKPPLENSLLPHTPKHTVPAEAL